MALRRYGWAFGALLALGCPAPEPKQPETIQDAGADGFPQTSGDPGDSEDPTVAAALFPDCVKACVTLHTLGCPEAEKPAGGKTCYAICRDAEKSVGFSLKPACVAQAKSVTEVRACKTVRCQK